MKMKTQHNTASGELLSPEYIRTFQKEHKEMTEQQSAKMWKNKNPNISPLDGKKEEKMKAEINGCRKKKSL